MSNWKYLKNTKTEITCKSDTNDIGNSEYYGCCDGCIYAHGKRGDSWLTDKIWCSCPVSIKKGQTIEVIEIQKYRIKNK